MAGEARSPIQAGLSVLSVLTCCGIDGRRMLLQLLGAVSKDSDVYRVKFLMGSPIWWFVESGVGCILALPSLFEDFGHDFSRLLGDLGGTAQGIPRLSIVCRQSIGISHAVGKHCSHQVKHHTMVAARNAYKAAIRVDPVAQRARAEPMVFFLMSARSVLSVHAFWCPLSPSQRLPPQTESYLPIYLGVSSSRRLHTSAEKNLKKHALA